LGKYIRTHRAKAHPKTFKILNSVFSSLDKVVLSKDMAESAKKKILRAEMNRYKDLRTQIDISKAAAVKRKAKGVAVEAPQTKDKKEAPVAGLDEPSVVPEFKEKGEEPVLTLDEPSDAPGFKAKEEEPVLTLDEPSDAPGFKENGEKPVVTLDEASGPPARADRAGYPSGIGTGSGGGSLSRSR